MRIAMVHASFGVRGGAEQYIRDIARSLATRGHEVRIFCTGSANGDPDDTDIGDRLSARLGARLPGPVRKGLVHLGDLVDPTGLRPRDLRAFAPDVVHVHNWQQLGAVPVERISKAYPTCHTVHDHAICDPNNALRNLGRSTLLDAALAVRAAWVVRRFRRVALLFSTERVRETVRRHARRADTLTSFVLPLAVSVPWHRLEWQPGGRGVFLFMGALSPHKGLDVLLTAWRSTHAATGGTLLIAGDGPLRAEVELLAATMPSVRYLGYLDHDGKRAALSAAGWLVFPSRSAETFGLVCAEALMAGRPIIAAANARPPMATDTSTLVFRDAGQLGRLLQRAATMPAHEYAGMAASAAADGRKLDWDDHIDALVGVYERVRARGGVATRRERSGSGR
jgi:glycosyltransferase involved in cell wall biosynthesis